MGLWVKYEPSGTITAFLFNDLYIETGVIRRSTVLEFWFIAYVNYVYVKQSAARTSILKLNFVVLHLCNIFFLSFYIIMCYFKCSTSLARSWCQYYKSMIHRQFKFCRCKMLCSKYKNSDKKFFGLASPVKKHF